MTKNITVTVPEQTYRQARVWAAERDTSLSAVVAYLLESLPGIHRAARAFPAGHAPAPNPQTVPGDAAPGASSAPFPEKMRL
ncbi:MAG: hypothetical protein WB608_15370 [Terracidiphilus sp.]